MLVLSRKVGEKIVIAGDVHVTVVALVGNTVRLGIAAPKEVTVDREEVHWRRAGAGGSACPGRPGTDWAGYPAGPAAGRTSDRALGRIGCPSPRRRRRATPFLTPASAPAPPAPRR